MTRSRAISRLSLNVAALSRNTSRNVGIGGTRPARRSSVRVVPTDPANRAAAAK